MADQASPTLESPELEAADATGPTPVGDLAVPAEADTVAAADLAETPPRTTVIQAEGAVTGLADPGANEGLMSELARAMHEAATAQYERQNAELERRRAEQVEAIAHRASADVESLKAASEADVASIDAWAKAETEKIKQERVRRTEARRERLAVQLEHQATIREREVAAIEAAIDAHRQEVDRFFGRMERETDPAAIARVAATMPSFPPLAAIADSARAIAVAEFAPLDVAPDTEALSVSAESVAALEGDAGATVSESRLMAVMDPEASRLDAVGERPWEAPYAVSVAAGSGASPTSDDGSPHAPAAEHGSRVGSTLLRTVRAIRPVSGERHDSEAPR